jgi:hypothetical protein
LGGILFIIGENGINIEHPAANWLGNSPSCLAVIELPVELKLTRSIILTTFHGRCFSVRQCRAVAARALFLVLLFGSVSL